MRKRNHTGLKALGNTNGADAIEREIARQEKAGKRSVDEAVKNIRTPAEARRYQARCRQKLEALFGPFPKRTPLRLECTGVLRRGGVRIEKIIFQSRPEYFVTANLYIPENLSGPVPGTLIPCGHAALGKGARGYRETAMGLARKGYVALIYDPTGQGERSECFDPETKRHWVHREVPQHHWTGKPCFLAGSTLAGYRIWDGIRALDVLESRTEVDSSRIAVSGNSGGGAMTLLLTACDRRVKVCAAAHPGGSMENIHLRGLLNEDGIVYPLIAPRPCRIIVGDKSGEETAHRRKTAGMRPFYKAFGCLERLDFQLVDGFHDLKLPKRESAYEWLGRWFDMPDRSSREPPLSIISERASYCTPEGQVQSSYQGATMRSINAERAAQLTRERQHRRRETAPENTIKQLRRSVRKRVGFASCGAPLRPGTTTAQSDGAGTIRKVSFESEPGIPVPALFLESHDSSAPVVIHVSEKGKPQTIQPASLAFRLRAGGLNVLSLDVRDTGETSLGAVDRCEVWPPRTPNWRNFNVSQWRHDRLAVRALGLGRTLAGMRALDVVRAVDWLRESGVPGGKRPLVIGEEGGAVWALLAGGFDRRIAGVGGLNMLASYRMLTDSREYNRFGEFWVPGALIDYDLCELPLICAPAPVMLVNPVDAMGRNLSPAQAGAAFRETRTFLRQTGRSGLLTVKTTRKKSSATGELVKWCHTVA